MSRIVIVMLIYHCHKPIVALTCWARIRLDMILVSGTDKPRVLI
jgi:hypothetical protein